MKVIILSKIRKEKRVVKKIEEKMQRINLKAHKVTQKKTLKIFTNI